MLIMKQVLGPIKSFPLGSPRLHSAHQQWLLSYCVSILVFLCIASFITGCQKENLQSISQAPDQLSLLQKQDQQEKLVPFRGKFTIDLKTNVSTGEGTHVGRFTAVGTSNTGVFPDINAATTSTTANGDQIFTTDIGLAQDPDGDGIYNVYLTCTITGGTGRFAGATGSYKTHAIVNFSLGEGSATFEGTIAY
jgi:hypothetical protein